MKLVKTSDKNKVRKVRGHTGLSSSSSEQSEDNYESSSDHQEQNTMRHKEKPRFKQ